MAARCGAARAQRALVRLLLLEARRNREILNVAIGGAEPLPKSALWQVPLVLETEVIETVLGMGEQANLAIAEVRELPLADKGDSDAGDFLTNIYVRLVALKGLAALNRESELERVQIERRLRNMREDLATRIKPVAR